MDAKESVKLVFEDLIFLGPKTLTQFSIIDIIFDKSHENSSKFFVQILLQRICYFHITNTFLPTVR